MYEKQRTRFVIYLISNDMSKLKTPLGVVFYKCDYDPLRNTPFSLPLSLIRIGGVSDWHQSYSYREPGVF